MRFDYRGLVVLFCAESTDCKTLRCGLAAVDVHFVLGGSTFFMDVHFIRVRLD